MRVSTSRKRIEELETRIANQVRDLEAAGRLVRGHREAGKAVLGAALLWKHLVKTKNADEKLVALLEAVTDGAIANWDQYVRNESR